MNQSAQEVNPSINKPRDYLVKQNCFILIKMYINLRADILLLVSILEWTNANNKFSIAMSLIEGGVILLDSTVFNYN